MSWDDLRIVLALVRAGTLSAAARALALDRTTVARRLAGLEAALGTRLVDRRGGAQRPTAAAQAVAARAEEMEAAALAVEQGAAGADARVSGVVRVTASEALGTRLLAPALARLAAQHPGLRVDLALEARALSLAHGEADVAVRMVPAREPTSVARRVGTVGYGAYAARAALGRGGAPEGLVTWDDLIAGAESAWLRARYPAAPVRLRANSTGALLEAVRAGGGAAVLPCFVGDADPALRRLDRPGEIPGSPLLVLVHRDARRVARVAAVRAAVEAALQEAAAALAGTG